MLEYSQCANQIGSILSRARQHISEDALIERIDGATVRLQNDRLKILIVGEFSRGKSTFINTLLGLPLLPSKVNPTTATINIIRNGEKSSINIHINDGSTETHLLPDEGIAKFLDTIVTTSNDESAKISQVEIIWPGGIHGWNALIVDTPGVNDLDDLREDLTYSYLSQADACIVLLDSQQPLTASELRFVNDKVMGNDVSRLFFVINRMDEIPKPNSDPDEATSQRLMTYVSKRLIENVKGVNDPILHAVASKPVLRQRFKDTPSSWTVPFEEMESNLFKFINANATHNRVPDHLSRALNILGDSQHIYESQLKMLDQSKRQISKEMDSIKLKQKSVSIKMDHVQTLLLSKRRDLTKSLNSSIGTSLDTLRTQFIEEIQTCDTEDEVLALKSSMNRQLRGILEEVEFTVKVYRDDIESLINEHFKEEFVKPIKINRSLISNSLASNSELISYDKPFEQPEDSASGIKEFGINFGIGGVAGFLGATLLGPIGVALAMFGAGTASNLFSNFRENERREEARQKAIHEMKAQIESVLQSCAHSSETIAEREINQIELQVKEIIGQQQQQLSSLLNVDLDQVKSKTDELAKRKQDLNVRIESIIQLRDELEALQGAMG